jgi:hypothetical protein
MVRLAVASFGEGDSFHYEVRFRKAAAMVKENTMPATPIA